MEQRKIYKSRRDRMLMGICGGLGEYLNVDATIIRLIWAILGCTGTGILVYIIAAFVIPESPY